MLISGLILALFAWTFFAGMTDVPGTLLIGTPAAIAAGLAFISAAAAYLWVPRSKLQLSAFMSYCLVIVMTVLLLLDSGLTTSPFIALWMLMVFFAPVFGANGLLVTSVIMAAYVVRQVIDQQIDFSTLSTVLLFFVMPLGTGLLLWRHKRNTETEEDRSFSELANKLSSVSGQSEVVISAISDGVLALDQKGQIKLINPAAQRIIGWGSDDALGLNYKSVLNLLDSQDKPVEDNNNPIEQALLQQKENTSEHYSILTADSNRKILLSISVSPAGAADSGAIVVFRDITKAKAEEREQAEFISTASHEMRTPVASIEGYLGLALNPSTAQIDEKARDFITKAHESAKHLGRLFQDLLDVSRADDGRLSNNPTVIDLVELTHTVAEGLLPQATAKNLRINFKPRPDLYDSVGQSDDRVITPVFYTKADADHLREVLGNLVENAIKYTLEGSIAIDVTGDDDSITVSIQDSGIGIPKEDIDHLFQKFYRVDNSDTREIGGTGLGLYLSRKLIEAIGGTIWVESIYKQGSTFFIRLPRLDAIAARQEIEASAMTDQPIIAPAKVQPIPEPPVLSAPQVQPQPVAAPPAPVPGVAAPPQPAPTPPVQAAPVTAPYTPTPQPMPVVQPQPYAPMSAPTSAPTPIAATAPPLAPSPAPTQPPPQNTN